MNNRFLRACRRQPVDATPVWFMRQAGRSLPEYRRLRERYSLLEICRQPELAAQATLQPVRLLGVDAAILFADLLLPAVPLGLGLEYAKGEGPVIRNPVRSLQDVDRLRPVDVAADLGFVLETVRILRGELGEIPLIGFCGAPFTFASYLIEGGSSRDFPHTREMLRSAPGIWHALMGKITPVLTAYLLAQVRAGAQAVQVFDSWAGALNPEEYEAFALPYSHPLLQAAEAAGIPVIHFGTDTAQILPQMRRAGGTVFGLDWRLPLDEGWKRVGLDVAVQGNLDPRALLEPLPELKVKVEAVLRRAAGRPGHIFNLGHGLLPETPVEHVRAVVEMVHELTARGPVQDEHEVIRMNAKDTQGDKEMHPKANESFPS